LPCHNPEWLKFDPNFVPVYKQKRLFFHSHLYQLKYTLAVDIEVVGNPDMKIGDIISLEGMPNPVVEGELEVRSVEHYLSKTKGFTTRLDCWVKRGEV